MDQLTPHTPTSISEVKLGHLYTLADLIRANVGKSHNWVATKISNALVRVASTRIFSNPYQSIMEPIANSIDAYGGGTAIGRFGLGFYSIFYWLVQDDGDSGRYIEIVSRTRDEYWAAQFRYVNDLAIEFLPPPLDPIYYPDGITGTLIKIANLPKKDMDKFVEQIRRFFTPDVLVKLYYDTLEPLYVQNRDSVPEVIVVILIRDEVQLFDIYIKDYDGGITTRTLFKSLIVPTSSTKGLPTSPKAPQVQTRLSTNSGNLGFYILVEDVAVVHLKLDISKVGYFIKLKGVSVPVSRDDIILDQVALGLLHTAFRDLAASCIGSGYELDDYFQHLRAYANYTDQLGITEIIRDVHQWVLQQDEILFLPSRQIVEIMRQGGYSKVNYLSDINLIESRNKLDLMFDQILGREAGRNILRNIRFIHLVGSFEPTDAGIPGYIFIDDPDFEVEMFINSYQGALLRRVTDPVSDVDLSPEALLSPGALLGEHQINEFAKPNINHSVLIFDNHRYRRRDLPDSSFPKEYPSHSKNSVYSPTLDVADLILMMGGLYRREMLLLYSTIESWVLSLANTIKINVTEPGRYYSESDQLQRILFQVDVKTPIRTYIIELIFKQCILSIITLMSLDGIKEAGEYIVTLCEFFTHIKLEIGQGERKMIWFSRTMTLGWINKRISSGPDTFQVTDFLPEFNKIQRDGFFLSLKRLLDDQLYLRGDIVLLDSRFFPDVGLNGLYHVLYQLYREKIDLRRLLRSLLDQSQSALEMNIVCDIITNFVMTTPAPSIELSQQLLSQVADGSVVAIILTELKKRFAPSLFIHYLTEPADQRNIDWITDTVYVPMTKALETHLALRIRGRQECRIYNLISGSDVLGEFSLQKLISYVFNNDQVEVASLQDLIELITRVNTWSVPPGQVKLQMVEIAINTGTTKPYIDSVLTELLQNSLDAIKRTQNQDPILVKFCAKAPQFQLTFTDRVGIDISAILSLLIPFLSSKSTSDLLSTGEMGTGFYNVYRQPWCQQVIILTRDFHVTGIPIRHEDGLVHDIIYTLRPGRKDFTGTVIDILSPALSDDEFIIQTSLDVHIYAQTYFRSLGHPIKFNGKLINDGRERLLKQLFDRPDYKVNLHQIGIHQSILMTNNVPFGPLVPFLENIYGTITNSLLNTNIILNLGKGLYTPTQGRNRFTMLDDQKKTVLTDILSTTLASATITKLVTADDVLFERYMEGSTADIGLNNFPSNGPRFYVFNRNTKLRCRDCPFYQENGKITTYKTIWAGILRSYRRSEAPPSPELTRQYLSEILDPEVFEMYLVSDFAKIMDRWLSNKLPSSRIPIVINKAVASSESNPLDILLGIFRKFTDAYYTVARRVKLVGFDFSRIPEVYFGDTGNDNWAVYMPRQHQIVVNQQRLEAYATPAQLVDEWSTYLGMQREGLSTDARQYLAASRINKYLGNTFPGAIVPHEILHALAASDHKAGHSPLSFSIREKEYHDIPFEETIRLLYNTCLLYTSPSPRD